jgi:flagellar basal-body rod protein FlgB
MEPIHLFDVAAKQARWLSMSQAVIAGNVSNANTPGYKAQSVQPFADILDKTQLQLASTSASHLDLSPAEQQDIAVKDEASWETTDSGNSVSLEQEMIKASDVNRSFSLNTSIVKAFHGMLLAAVRS